MPAPKPATLAPMRSAKAKTESAGPQAEPASDAAQATNWQSRHPWPVDTPEPWEAGAVDLTRANNATKNQAWRRLKSEAPAEAQHLAGLLPQLKAAFGDVQIHVPSDWCEPE